MTSTTPTVSDKLKAEVNNWTNEEVKFAAGNKSAGTRARKALSEIMKLAKERRAEITAEKAEAND
jgi:hypothetical protein